MKAESQALEVLGRYSWPGNVRELENVVERAVLVADGDLIELKHLAPEILGEAQAGRGDSRIRVEIPPGISGYKDVVKEVADIARQKLILKALSENDNNVTHSARALGMSRRHLIVKMQEMNLGQNSNGDKEN